jgi:hypothetical protein
MRGLPTVGGPGAAHSVSTPRGRCVAMCVCGNVWFSVLYGSGFVAWARRRRLRATSSSMRGPWGPHGAAWLRPCRASALFTPSRVLAGTGIQAAGFIAGRSCRVC